jgi:hypothetical protein
MLIQMMHKRNHRRVSFNPVDPFKKILSVFLLCALCVLCGEYLLCVEILHSSE